MSIQPLPTTEQFSTHIDRFQKQLDLLKSFKVPPFKSWLIDWSLLGKVEDSKIGWINVDELNQLKQAKYQPAIYYFISTEIIGIDVYESFLLGKSTSSTIRVNGNIKGKDFFNISHVPKNYHETNCLYVGSVKKDLYSRLKGHLGYGPNRTGALFLKQALSRLEIKPPFNLNYCLLDEKYVGVTEHIERVFQDHFKPLIGQKTFKNVKSV